MNTPTPAPSPSDSSIAQSFRKKPVVIQAKQWFKDGDHPAVTMRCDGDRFVPWCPTLEDGHVVTPGDWIITGVKGEHYPCKPDIFEMTYEPVSAPVAAVGGGKDAEPEDDPQHALSVEQAIARLTDAVHEGAVKHAHFREVNGMDVDYQRCIGAGLFSAANKGLFSLTPPHTHPDTPAGGFVVVPREPTEAMKNAGRREARRISTYDSEEFPGYVTTRNIWEAMIAASTTAQPSAKDGEDFPECSGKPNDCPENEGYGCCKVATQPERHPTHNWQEDGDEQR